MALLTAFAQSVTQNEEKVAAWEERLQVLKMMQAMTVAKAAGKNICTFVERYEGAVKRERERRGGELLEMQTRMVREEEMRSQLGRYESQVAQLRELLAGKEEQLQFLCQDNKRTKPTTAHCQNLLLFNHQNELFDKLKEELAIKAHLQREILQLQTQHKPIISPKVKKSQQREKIDISYLRELAKQQQKRQRLQNIYQTLQVELSDLYSFNSTFIQRYQSAYSLLTEKVSLWDSSSKTICSTSDEQSL